MNLDSYLGHESQLCSVEEVRMIGGKGDGMRLLQVRNAAGLEFTISADRCADISRLIYKGDNMGYFSPCGYVAPSYYDEHGNGFLKSFTAGFLTTCGLVAAGSPCEDEGEHLPLHGTIGNTPCDRIWWTEDGDNIQIHAEINDSGIFSHKLRLHRAISCPKDESKLTIADTIENRGDTTSPVMLLYHLNMGYPLLSERSVVEIPSQKVIPRNDHAAKDLGSWQKMLPPTVGFEEQCYYHTFAQEGHASIYNPDIRKGLRLSFDARKLWNLTEWKMMGVRDYVLGLEPGNCTPDGRDVMRRQGKLQMLQPGESTSFHINIFLYTDAERRQQK